MSAIFVQVSSAVTKHKIKVHSILCVHTVNQGRLNEETNKCGYELCTLCIDHTYLFRASATILRVHGIKEYNRSCVWRIRPRSDIIKCFKIPKFLVKP